MAQVKPVVVEGVVIVIGVVGAIWLWSYRTKRHAAPPFADSGALAGSVPAKPAKVAAPSWGKLVEPDGDCRFSEKDRKVTIEIPGKLHDLAVEYQQTNAPRIIQDVEGDFRVDVKVGGDFRVRGDSTSSRYTGYHGAGVLVWIDANTYVRLERASVNHTAGFPLESSYSYVNLELRSKGKKRSIAEMMLIDQSGAKIYDRQTHKPGTSDGTPHPTYLRVERRGDRLYASTSQDNVNYVNLDAISVVMPRKIQVGMVAVNSALDRFVCTFEGWHVAPVTE